MFYYLIANGEGFEFRGTYEKNKKIISTFYNKKPKKKKDVLLEFKSRLRMRNKMETKQGKEIYRWRKITVEPVIGQIKEVFEFRRFLLRGLEGVRIEFNIVSLSHNLKKIYLARAKGSGNFVVFESLSFIMRQAPVLYEVNRA